MLWAIKLRTTPGSTTAWVGWDGVPYIGGPAMARKFSLPADAECWIKSRESYLIGPAFPGFIYQVETISLADHWEEPPPRREIVPFAIELEHHAARDNGRVTA